MVIHSRIGSPTMGCKVYHIFLSLVHTLAFVILNEIFFHVLITTCYHCVGKAVVYRSQKMFNLLEIFITLTSFFLSFSARKENYLTKVGTLPSPPCLTTLGRASLLTSL